MVFSALCSTKINVPDEQRLMADDEAQGFNRRDGQPWGYWNVRHSVAARAPMSLHRDISQESAAYRISTYCSQSLVNICLAWLQALIRSRSVAFYLL